MPRGASSRTVAASRKKNTNKATQPTEDEAATTQENDMSAPTFNFQVEEAPEDYAPERRNPGRTRTPSPFDDLVLEKQGRWQRVPFTSDDERKVIERELTKAAQYRGLGLERNVTETHVEFKSREKQPRKPRAPKASENGTAALAEGQTSVDPDGDNDE